MTRRSPIIIAAACALAVGLFFLGFAWRLYADEHEVAVRSLDSAARTRAQVGVLQERIAELEARATATAEEAATNRAVIEALSAQLEQLGGRPVAAAAPRASPTPATVAPTPTTNPAGHVPPGQQKCRVVDLLGLCI